MKVIDIMNDILLKEAKLGQMEEDLRKPFSSEDIKALVEEEVLKQKIEIERLKIRK